MKRLIALLLVTVLGVLGQSQSSSPHTVIAPNDGSSGAILRLREAQKNGTNYLRLIAPTSISSNYDVYLPPTAGTLLLGSGTSETCFQVANASSGPKVCTDGSGGFSMKTSADVVIFTCTSAGVCTFQGTGGGEIELPGATSGSVTLGVPAVAGTGTEITFPAVTGTVALTAAIPVSATVLDPVAGDDRKIMLADFPYAVTVTRFTCDVLGGTNAVVNLVQVAESDPEAAGTAVMSSDATCTAGAFITPVTSFADATVPAHYPLMLHVHSVSGTNTALRIAFEVTKD